MPFIYVAVEHPFRIEVMPALTRTVCAYLYLKRRAIFRSKVNLICNLSVGGTYDSFNIRRLKPVLKVIVFKLIHRRNRYCTYLVKSYNCGPELIITL